MLFQSNLQRNDSSVAMHRRRGFTLIELLVVLTVMVTLGGMLTYALASAANEARLKRTQADVLTIGQLLQTRMNEISLSKVELVYLQPANLSTSITAASGPGSGAGRTAGNINAQEQSRLVLAARRDLLRMVLPECRADLLYPPASLPFRSPVGGGFRGDVAQVKPPEQWNRMRTLAGLPSSGTLDSLAGAANPTTDPSIDAIEVAFDESATVPSFTFPFDGFTLDYVPPGGGTPVRDTIYDDPAIPANPGEPDDRFWTRENESAECLYLILATTELFGQKAIDRVSAPALVIRTETVFWKFWTPGEHRMKCCDRRLEFKVEPLRISSLAVLRSRSSILPTLILLISCSLIFALNNRTLRLFRCRLMSSHICLFMFRLSY